VPYASDVGSLMYVMVYTRSDITQVVRVISRYMSDPNKHWRAVKWILRYLKGSSDMALCYDVMDVHLYEYENSDFASDVNSRRSNTVYVFTLRSGVVSWVLRLQKIVVLSTMEVEYVAVTEAYKELIWLKNFYERVWEGAGDSVTA